MSRAGKGRARLNLLAIYSMIFLNNMGMLMSPSMDTLVNAFPSEPYSKVLLISTLPALVALPFIMLAGNLAGIRVRYRTLALLMVLAGGVTAAIDFIYAIITVLRHAGDVTKVYLICFAVSVVLPVILINLLGLMGAVVSYLAIMALLLVLLIVEYAHIRQRIERARNPYGA